MYSAKALVCGGLGLVRMLGREGVPVTLARESHRVFDRFSRYCREFVCLPDLSGDEDGSVRILEEYGRSQSRKPVVFLNGEADVLLFSRQRDRLYRYYRVDLADHDLLVSLINKQAFAELAQRHGLPSPRTFTPTSRAGFHDAARRIGYPCILKPVQQRLWSSAKHSQAVGNAKAVIMHNSADLDRYLDVIPHDQGTTMIQQYIPGNDQQLYDCHIYLNRAGELRGSVIGHKIRTWPVQFGMGCYTHTVESPEIRDFCLEALNRIGYTGVANINLKRDSSNGSMYILEINPRYSLWSVIDSVCGLNIALMRYCDLTGQTSQDKCGELKSARWLFVANDFKAMWEYRRRKQLTLVQWLTSFYRYRGRLEFHVFSFDDPLPLIANQFLRASNVLRRLYAFIARSKSRMRARKTSE